MSRFYVRIPLCCLHLSHPVGGSATMGQYVDKRILDKIYELANHNVTNIAKVKRCLERYVENEVFGDVAGAKKPKKTNRRYYSSRKDLRNHIAQAISAQKYLTTIKTVTTIKSLSASRFAIGKKDLLKRGSSIEQETIHLPCLIQQGKTPLKRAPFSLSIKSHGSSNC